jgi:hypothetical protein
LKARATDSRHIQAQETAQLVLEILDGLEAGKQTDKREREWGLGWEGGGRVDKALHAHPVPRRALDGYRMLVRT